MKMMKSKDKGVPGMNRKINTADILRRMAVTAGAALLMTGGALTGVYAEEAAAPVPAAGGDKTIVVMDVSNRTGYGKNRVAKILEDCLTTDLFDVAGYAVLDRMDTDAVDNVEGKLTKSYQTLDRATVKFSPDLFASILLSQETPVYNKEAGDVIPAEDFKVLKEAYHAKYLLHPTLEMMEEDHGGGLISALSGMLFGKLGVPLRINDTNVKMKATVTYRLINGETGEVVWVKQANGSGKNTKISIAGLPGNLAAGNNQTHEGLTLGAIQKVSDNGVKALEEEGPDSAKALAEKAKAQNKEKTAEKKE